MTGDGQALVDELAATIQARVLSGEIPTGTRLRQESLAAEFGVSRTPVREALRKLQASGLVEVQPRPGRPRPAAERPRRARGVRGAGRARGARGGARGLADPRRGAPPSARGPGALPSLRRVAARLAKAAFGRTSCLQTEAHEEWISANDSFHLAIQEAAGNRRLRDDPRRPAPELPARPHLDRALRERRACSRRTSPSTRRSSPRSSATTPSIPARLMVEHVLTAGQLVTRRFEEGEVAAERVRAGPAVAPRRNARTGEGGPLSSRSS